MSTPAVIAPGTGTMGQIKTGLKLVNPLQPTAPMRPLFAKAGQESSLPLGGPVIGIALDTAARTIEAIPSIALKTIANFRGFNTKDLSAKVDVPFDASRIGVTDQPGQTFVQNTGAKMLQVFDELEAQNPGKKTNIAVAALTPITDALDAFATGELLTSVARVGLKATQYSPELKVALQKYGLEGVSGEELTQEFVRKFNNKARSLVIAEDIEGLNDLGNATNVIMSHMTGSGIPKLNRLGQLIQDTSRLALQDVKSGFRLKNPMFPEIAPEVTPGGLPGTVEEAGQGLPVGLSVRRVRRVGGATPETPGPYFRSKSGGTSFDPVQEKDVLPVNLGKDLDTFVVKDGDGYAVIEGKTGTQIGQTEKTSALAIESARQEIKNLGPQLNQMIDQSPLSPRYEIDPTPDPAVRQIAWPKPEPKPVMTPASAEVAASEYYDAKIRPALAEGKPFVIGADDLKDYFGNDYNDVNHPIYSRAAFSLYEKAIKETKGGTVLLTGGGPGAGKTEFLVKQLSPDLEGVLYDSNMSNKQGVMNQIKMARDAGKDVIVAGLLPDLASTRVHTILRENATGRGISDKTFARGHAGFPRVLKELLDEGVLKPSEVLLYDTRKIFKPEDVIDLVVNKGFEKDPLATLNKVQYNEEEIAKKYAKETYKAKVNRGPVESTSRKGTDETSVQNRPDRKPTERQGDRKDVQRGSSKKAPEDIGQLIRMLDREKQSLASALSNPEMHAKAYGPGKIEEYKKKIKSLTKRIEEDAPTRRSSKQKDIEKLSPLEIRIEEFKTEKQILEDVIANNPARQLSKFANRNGELPEVLGGEGGKFKKSGDDIVKELGFSSSEEARDAYQQYRLQQKRYFVLRNNIRVLTETLQEMKLDEKDINSLKSFLNRDDVANTAKGVKDPETKEMLEERKRMATARQSRLMKDLGAMQPGVQKETLQSIGEVLQNSQPISQADFEKLSEDFSFDKILVDTNTPVKDKVNLLDYLRTPDRVLKKIGLEKTAEQVRHAYESYLAELPVHIDLISSWADRVPKDANKRIFQYLDGQQHRKHFSGEKHTKLIGEELKVANEIRAYLKEWADRLGLPEDNKISHYITHIFDIGDVEKEFDEDIAKLIKDKVPGSVYDPFLEKRLGRKGYIEDTWASLDAYVKRAVRKANMDPVLEKLKDASSKMEDSQATYIKRYANLINMRPTEIDNLLDNLIKSVAGYRFGQRPVALMSRKARQWVYRSMLGLNVTSAIRNLTQGVNTFSELGARATLKGYTDLVTKARSSELEDVGVLRQDFVQDRALSSTRKRLEKLDKGLFFLFDLAERINRGAAYYAAKDKALRLGASEFQAVEYAKKIVRDTQFQFGSIDTPVGLNSDLMKVATQFMSFGFKQTEFAAEKILKKDFAAIMRYIVGALALTYGVGQVFDIKGKDFIPGYSFLKFGTPPTLALPVSIFKAVVDAPGRFGNEMTYSDKALDIFSNIPFPASIQAKKIYRSLTDNKKKSSALSSSSKNNSSTVALKRLNRLKNPVKANPALKRLDRLKNLNVGL